MKNFIFGLALYLTGLFCGFFLLYTSIRWELEPHIIRYKNIFFLVSFIGLLICIVEIYFRERIDNYKKQNNK